jgi:hypothetical protein
LSENSAAPCGYWQLQKVAFPLPELSDWGIWRGLGDGHHDSYPKMYLSRSVGFELLDGY